MYALRSRRITAESSNVRVIQLHADRNIDLIRFDARENGVVVAVVANLDPIDESSPERVRCSIPARVSNQIEMVTRHVAGNRLLLIRRQVGVS